MALKKLNDLLKKSLRNFLQALKSFKKALVLLEMYLRIFFHAINGLKRVKEVNSNIFKKFSRGYYYWRKILMFKESKETLGSGSKRRENVKEKEMLNSSI